MSDILEAKELPQQPSRQEHADSSEMSSVEADDLAYEHSAERLDDVLHAEAAPKSIPNLSVKKAGNDVRQGARPVSIKDPIVIEVEKILEDGMGLYYQAMPDQAKIEFRKKGEAVALEISEMVRTLHVKFKKLIHLISDWLKTIPGVNRFFLEQEAKIKADRIMQLIEARKSDQDRRI